MYEFTKLKATLGTVTSLRDLDPSDLLYPFLQVFRKISLNIKVITSVDTTGNITGVALTSVYNFVNYRILGWHPSSYY